MTREHVKSGLKGQGAGGNALGRGLIAAAKEACNPGRNQEARGGARVRHGDRSADEGADEMTPDR